MKGLVLAGGAGSRLRPITYSMAKQLVPIANTPIIEYGLRDLVAAGVTDIGIVISPQTGDAIREAVGRASLRLGFTPSFIEQDAPRGLAHALLTALPYLDGEPCVMYLGDNLVKDGVAAVVDEFGRHQPECQILLAPVDNAASFGVAELDAGGAVIRLVEKPADPPSNLALVGVYLFAPSAYDVLPTLQPSARGELEITDAIQSLIDRGSEVRASIVSGWWKDTGTRADLLAAQHLVIAELASDVVGTIEGGTVAGQVRLGRGSRLIDCVVTGPVVVGEDSVVERSVLGPETCIGSGCRVADARLERSLVMDDARVTGWWLHESILGHGVTLTGPAPTGFVTVMLGEQSTVGPA